MKRLSTLVLVLMTFIVASAQTVTAEQALSKARAFAQKRQAQLSKGQQSNTLTLTPIAQRELLNSKDGKELYAYNIGNGQGFVIISGDERMPEVFGYADEGSLDPQQIPENMRFWMQQYAENVKQLQAGKQMTAIPTHSAVAPFLTAKWNQGAPYNMQCPKDTKDGKASMTGCVATAMAQVLYYVQPDGCTTLNSYITEIRKMNVPALPSTTFNWSIMRNTYTSSDNDASAQEVAKLMRYCGQAVEMDYKSSTSGAYASEIAPALIDNFGLSPNIENIDRYDYTSLEWDNMIYKELVEGRPVMIGGRNMDAGHRFLCHGYDGAGLYYINWGWGGSSDGFFDLNHLNPDNQGIGGSNGGYSGNMDIIIGIRKTAPGDEKIITPAMYDMNAFNINVSRSSSSKDFNFGITTDFANFNQEGHDYEIRWALYDEYGNFIKATDPKPFNIDYQYLKSVTFNVNFGAGLSNGTYKLKAQGHQKGASGWKLCRYAADGIVTMVINNNNASISYNPPAATSYKVSNMSISGDMVVNADNVLTLTVTNNGGDMCNSLYIIVDNTVQSDIAINLDPGESETYTANVAFDTVGNHTIKIATRKYNSSTQDWDYTVISSAISCTIKSQQFCSLTYTFELGTTAEYNGGSYTIYQNTCDLRVTYTNNTNTEYRGNAGFYMGWYEDGSLWYYPTPDAASLLVPAHGSKTITYTYTDLEYGTTYLFYPTYETASNTWGGRDWNKALEVKVDDLFSGINSLQTAPNTNADIYTLDGRKVSNMKRGMYIIYGKKFVK